MSARDQQYGNTILYRVTLPASGALDPSLLLRGSLGFRRGVKRQPAVTRGADNRFQNLRNPPGVLHPLSVSEAGFGQSAREEN